jgi:hypothetical protein
MRGTCERCGRVARLEGHHPTCRLAGCPIHSFFVFSICAATCHAEASELLYRVGLAATSDRPAVLLRRVALFLGWWDRALEPGHVATLAEVVADIADRIEDGR